MSPQPQSLLCVTAMVLMIGCGSSAQTPVALAGKSQTSSLVFYDSKTNRFATVTAILPVLTTQASAVGQWRGELLATYTRPLTNVILTSDKLSMTNWHSLICMRDPEKPSAFVLRLHPDEPDDYVTVHIPAFNGAVTGLWYYATDGGLVDSGTLVSTIHK